MSTDTPTSRAEHHADSPAHTVRYSRRVVHRALVAGHVGRANAVHGSDLARFVPVKETTVRDVIAELRDDPAGPPIGSCGDGYFVIADPTELDEWVEGVKSEIQTRRERIQANVRAFNRRKSSGIAGESE